MSQRSLSTVLEQTQGFHEAVFALWNGLPDPQTRRSFLVGGFCAIVQQHAVSQAILAHAQCDVSATTLVRPTFEALVRAMWCMAGAGDGWIERFLTPTPEALAGDAETAMGPPVQRMLDDISGHHPPHIHQALLALKAKTWRAMHSYVHGGIRPLAQGMSGFREHETAGVVINANGMLMMATNLLRMSRGLPSPKLPQIQRQYAACLPPMDS